MSNDSSAGPASAAREIAHFFGLIGNTLEWNYTEWMALSARLEAYGKPIHSLTLADVELAVAATSAAPHAEVRHDA